MAEDKDVPARVTLIEIPSRNEVRVKNLFNVADCKMHWQVSVRKFLPNLGKRVPSVFLLDFLEKRRLSVRQGGSLQQAQERTR